AEQPEAAGRLQHAVLAPQTSHASCMHRQAMPNTSSTVPGSIDGDRGLRRLQTILPRSVTVRSESDSAEPTENSSRRRRSAMWRANNKPFSARWSCHNMRCAAQVGRVVAVDWLAQAQL